MPEAAGELLLTTVATLLKGFDLTDPNLEELGAFPVGGWVVVPKEAEGVAGFFVANGFMGAIVAAGFVEGAPNGLAKD